MSDGWVVTCAGGTIYQGGSWYDGIQDQNMAVFKSTDLGNSWSRYRLGSGNGEVRAFATSPADTNLLLAGGRDRGWWSGCIFRTADGGGHWVKVDSSDFGDSESCINGIAFDPAKSERVLATLGRPYPWFNGNTGFGVQISTDAGLTWSKPTQHIDASCIVADPATAGRFFAGSYDGVWVSEDHGTSWQQINNGLPTLAILSLAYDPVNKFLYAGTQSGGAFRLDVESALGVEPNEKPQVPSNFVLCQNYPNPFNPSTVIKYTVGGAGNQGPGAREAGAGGQGLGAGVKLAVYDLLGREVAVLVNERKPTGSYEVPFNAEGLASGVYVYRLTAGSFVEARAMVLVK